MEIPQAEAYTQLEQSVQAALETYSNVHRGSGQASMVSTHLYEHARDIILEYLGLSKDKYTVIFCSPRRAEQLKVRLKPNCYHILSSQDTGLALGIRALAVRRQALPKGAPFQTGGGTARLVSPGWVVWAKAPDRFEAGTPAIVNAIAFAKALQLMGQYGNEAFRAATLEKRLPDEILYHDGLEKFSGRELLDELRQTLIGGGVRVPTRAGAQPFINLDNGASTPTFMPIWEAVYQSWRQPRQVQLEIIEAVKSICANALGAPLADHEVIFASNTTEAINLAAESLKKESGGTYKTVVLNTLLEHNSNELPWRSMRGVSLVRLPVDAEGFLNLQEMEKLLSAYNKEGQHGRKRIRLVAVSGASNVLGIFNDLAKVSQIVHRYGACLLVDAAQMAAHRKVEMERWGIDYLACSAHKVYAPFGSGVLVARKGLLKFSPAEMQLIRSSGEENVGGIAALGKAFVLLQRVGLDLIQKEEQVLTGQALRGLAQINGLTVYGIKDPDSPRFTQKGGVIAFGLKDRLPNQVARELAEQGGIGVRSGCHCAHLLIKHLLHVGPTLEQFQRVILVLFPQLALPGVVRVSLGIENSLEQVDSLVDVLGKIARQPPGEMENPFAAKRNGSSQTEIQRQMDKYTKAAAGRVYSKI
jgi:selenocysteine lyase/cysteine desulfurase